MSKICLRVKNIQSLDTHSAHHHIFGIDGGSIGSGADNAWVINDKDQQIQNIQALINFEEGIFGLKPYDKECKVFLNDSFSALPYSYETQINIGDYFKIGGLEIEIIAPETLSQEQNKVQTLSELGELAPYDKLDHIDIQPKGFEENFNPLEEEKLDILEENDDILGLNQPEDIPSSLSSPIPTNDYFVSYKNIQKLISQKTQTLQEQLCSTQTLTLNQPKLKMMDLQSRIEHFLLLENKELLNLLILSLLCESLQNPMFASIYPDFFEKSISEIIEECINGNGELLQKTLLTILNLRSKDKTTEE